jgi:4-hydroxy-tetrahydrodipicolinate synthase
MSRPPTPRAPLAGVFPVLCTPFDREGAIDFGSVDRLVDATLERGVDGLVVGGVASEVHKLDDGERRALVERVLARVAARGVPVWVGSGHASTEATIAHSLHAQRHGAAGVMVMPPHAHPAKPALAALAAFFRDLDLAIELPVMIQDAPIVSGIQLPVDWIVEVAASCRRIVAVKVEAPPTAPKIGELARNAPSLALLGGLGGANLVDELARGAIGTLPAAAFPELHVAIVEHARAGDLDAARRLQERAAPLLAFVSQSIEWSYHCVKRLLTTRGAIAHATVRRPTIAFGEADAAELRRRFDTWRASEGGA